MSERVLIAMSGGVDSSVAAYLMKQRGDDCIGVTMKLFPNETIGRNCSRTCCSLDDVEDARSVAYHLGIPYYVFNFSEAFSQQVIRRFVSAYETGATPNPCIDCNRYLKFERLYHRAQELDCDRVVTGHYARIAEEHGRYVLKKALDPSKDQSYVLYSLTQEQLAHTAFPCGVLPKTEIRRIAEAQGFLNAHKADSQDICFVPDGDYAGFIQRYTGKEYPPGPFVTENGTVLGQHRGIIHYTIGQRKGLGISSPEPLYVSRIDAEQNAIVLAHDRDLYRRELDADAFHWIAFAEPPRQFRAKAKIRYRQPEQWASITVEDEHTVHISFDAPQRAITPGQAVVLYQEDTVLGGGVIRSAGSVVSEKTEK